MAHDGFVDPAVLRARQSELLEHATQTFRPTSIINVFAHATRAGRDPEHVFVASSVTVEHFAPIFRAMDRLDDCTDFDMLYLLNVWLRHRSRLSAELRAAIEAQVLRFKYWFTEPTAPDATDHRWYWSENHRIIYHSIEYLAGAAFADETFSNDGRSGAEHRDAARALILDWIDEKVDLGWSEWHSDVYYQKDATPLLTLVEHAPDAHVAARAAMALDLLLFDIAVHLQHGNFGGTHGRSYMKDKSVAADQETFGFAKLLFADTHEPYPSHDDAGAVLFAAAERYRLPEVLARIAVSDATTVDRERMGVPLDPSAPIDLDAPAPYCYAFDDPANVAFWWERGIQATWQGLATTLTTLTDHDLWESMFFERFVPMRDSIGGDLDTGRALVRSLAPMLGFGLLTEVVTYTYRSPHVMLSSALDHRFGMFADQHHAWQATLDERAIVFTTHPKHAPQIGTRWPDDDGYWTGSGSMPASTQHGTAAIHVYDPAFDAPGPGPLAAFAYLPFTHAYFPQEHFDEVLQVGTWTFGRRHDGYVALWSQRPVRWRSAPSGAFTHGLEQPFDLVAPGGATNVWIVEVGDAGIQGSFDAFCDELASAEIEVERGAAEHDPQATRTTVRYESPSQGLMELSVAHGWPAALHVAGAPITLHGGARFDNPWLHAEHCARRFEIHDDDGGLVLDFDAHTRIAT